MSRVIAAIWSFMLIATTVGVVPVVLNLLRRALSAALHIEQYTVEILNSGVGIANNTAHVAALKDTLNVAPQLVGGAESIRDHVSAIETVLGKNGSTPEEVEP